ncbi:hypothetical protein EDB85DRAFT_2153174 [Lactarius pseudohatsudake]|nr:hypothetical protein EDB85DRAFT_2153174 [Lactarius pseudohatsudake]
MYLQSHVTRWTLGASDIMFTNPAFSTFFRKGETFRGTSIYQPAIDTAVKKLRSGAWGRPSYNIHLLIDVYILAELVDAALQVGHRPHRNGDPAFLQSSP